MRDFEAELGTLLRRREPSSVSIYLPLDPRPNHRQANEILWKNLYRRAHELLSRAEPRSDDALAAVSDAVNRVLDAPKGAAGCGVMHGGGDTHVYRLPVSVDPLVLVGDRFHVAPLLSARERMCRFRLLAIGRSHQRLYRGTESELVELPLPDDAPKGVEEVLPEGTPEKHLQSHSGAARGRSPVVHGQGLGERRQEADLHRYLHRLDESLDPVIADDLQLVVSGQAKLLKALAEGTALGARAALMIPGTLDATSHDSLLRRVVPALLEAKRQRQDAAAAELGALARAGKVRHTLGDVVPAADEGRVGTLFVARGARRWGCYDPRERRVEPQATPTWLSEDLVNLAALRTLENGGRVVIADRSALPEGAPAAAVLRY